MNEQQPPEIIPASALRAYVEQLDADRAAEQQTKTMFLESPERIDDAPGDAEALDDYDKQLIHRGVELVLLRERLERHQAAQQSPRLSRRKRRELERAERKVQAKIARQQQALARAAAERPNE